MKTVMKKMFSLLLVAVLLVGVMPFQAFADGEVYCHVCETNTHAWDQATHCANCGWYGNHDPNVICESCNKPCHDGSCCSICKVTGHTASDPHCTTCDNAYGHLNTDPKHCSSCSWYTVHAPNCVANCTGNNNCPNTANHQLNCIKLCTGNSSCPNTDYAKHIANCPKACTGEATCPNTANHQGTCKSLIICSYCKGKGHTADDGTCPELYCACGARNADKLHPAECTLVYDCCGGNESTKIHASDCPTYYACCGAAKTGSHKAECTQYFSCCGAAKTNGHAQNCAQYYYCCGASKTGDHASGCTSQKCPTEGCNSYKGHPGNCSNDPEEIPGDSTLKIFVNLYNANTKIRTYELTRYENISADTQVYSFIADREEQLRAMLPDDYSWSGNVYDANNKGLAEGMNAKVGTGRTVHINAYSGQDLVYIYVHTSRTFANVRVIQLEGKKINDTVTRDEVVAAVRKYYHLNSLYMYDEQAWENYVAGKGAQAVDTLKVTGEPFFIDVLVSGTARGTTYTADSTNPKTGDMIFTPMIVLGASVSALAVLFYLNKKRAF